MPEVDHWTTLEAPLRSVARASRGATQSHAGRSGNMTPSWSGRSDGGWTLNSPPCTTTTTRSSCSTAPRSGGVAVVRASLGARAHPRKRRVAFWKDSAQGARRLWSRGANRRRRVHSSVSRIAPIYHLQHEGAVYFASRIDPLVMYAPPATDDRLASLGLDLLPALPAGRAYAPSSRSSACVPSAPWSGTRSESVQAPSSTVGLGPRSSPASTSGPGPRPCWRRCGGARSPRGGPVACTLSGGWDSTPPALPPRGAGPRRSRDHGQPGQRPLPRESWPPRSRGPRRQPFHGGGHRRRPSRGDP